MTDLNPEKERIKHRYSRFLEEARGLAPSSIDHAARAISDYEVFSGRRDFKHFQSKTATDTNVTSRDAPAGAQRIAAAPLW